MHSFKDRDGRDWMIDITVLTVERVEAALKIDLPGLFDDKLQGLDRLLADDRRLMAVVFECCRTQAEKDGRTLDDLKAVWDGATADAAVEAFLGGLTGFFRDANRRAALTAALAKLKELGAKVMAAAVADMQAADLDAAAAAVIAGLRSRSASASAGSSGSTPATSALTPAPSP